MKRPARAVDAVLEYLDRLRAAPSAMVLQDVVRELPQEFPGMTKDDAAKCVQYWLVTWKARQR